MLSFWLQRQVFQPEGPSCRMNIILAQEEEGEITGGHSQQIHVRNEPCWCKMPLNMTLKSRKKDRLTGKDCGDAQPDQELLQTAQLRKEVA